MVDMSTVGYDAELMTESGARLTLNEAMTQLQWEEQKGELAQRAKLTLGNLRTGERFLHTTAKINCPLRIYGKWNGNRQLVFDGTIWDWQYESSRNKELTLTAYDPMIRLQQSKDFRYYPGGMTTQALIGDICDDWGIPLDYVWDKSITHEKQVFNSIRISDMIIRLLEEVHQKTGGRYAAHFQAGKLRIKGRGTNTDVYVFDGTNTESTSNTLSINNLVTRVKIIGRQNKDGRAPVEAVVDGDLRFGTLQEIVRRDSTATLRAAIDEANALIKERGKPEETFRIAVPDIPIMRKGDKVQVTAGNLIGFFFVEGITHYASSKKMMLTLTRCEE